jgi:transposase
MGQMIIAVDPHKASVTIEVIDRDGKVAATGRFGTDQRSYRNLLAYVRRWPHRVWAVEGAEGAGRPFTQRLLTDGETVRDVPAKLAARVRVLDTGQGRKTDATDAHSIAAVALRTPGLRQLAAPDGELVALRVLADRRDELSRTRAATLNRLHRLLAELIPGGAKRDLSADKAKALLATVRPRDVAGATRRRIAVDLLTDLTAVDTKLKAIKAELRASVTRRGSGLMGLYGMGPAGAARVLVDVGDVHRFPSKGHFASWNGTAPLDASSGLQIRHRLSRAGNRRINHVLHIMAIVQIRHDTVGRAYYRRLLDAGKTAMEALRILKRRLSDVVFRQLWAEQRDHQHPHPLAASARGAAGSDGGGAGPGGHAGATLISSADDLATPMAVSSEKSLPGPASPNATPDQRAVDPDADDDRGDGRRASAGAGPGLPTIALTRARRGSAVQGAAAGPSRQRSAQRTLDGRGASPYARGAANHRAAARQETGGEAATDQDPNPEPTNGALPTA